MKVRHVTMDYFPFPRKASDRFSLSLCMKPPKTLQPPPDDRVLTAPLKEAIEREYVGLEGMSPFTNVILKMYSCRYLLSYLQHLNVSPSVRHMEELRCLLPNSRLIFKLWWRSRGSTRDLVQISRTKTNGHRRKTPRDEAKLLNPAGISHDAKAVVQRSSKEASRKSQPSYTSTAAASLQNMTEQLHKIFSKTRASQRSLEMKSDSSAERVFQNILKHEASSFRHFLEANAVCQRLCIDKEKRAHRLRQSSRHGTFNTSPKSTVASKKRSSFSQSKYATMSEQHQERASLCTIIEEMREPIQVSLPAIASLLRHCPGSAPISEYRDIYAPGDVESLLVLLSHDSVTQLVALCCHFVYWKVCVGNISSENDTYSIQLEKILLRIFSTWLALLDAAHLHQHGTLFHVPLLLDSIILTVKVMFTSQYIDALSPQSKHKTFLFQEIDSLLDAVLLPNPAVYSDASLRRGLNNQISEGKAAAGCNMENSHAFGNGSTVLRQLLLETSFMAQTVVRRSKTPRSPIANTRSVMVTGQNLAVQEGESMDASPSSQMLDSLLKSPRMRYLRALKHNGKNARGNARSLKRAKRHNKHRQKRGFAAPKSWSGYWKQCATMRPTAEPIPTHSRMSLSADIQSFKTLTMSTILEHDTSQAPPHMKKNRSLRDSGRRGQTLRRIAGEDEIEA